MRHASPTVTRRARPFVLAVCCLFAACANVVPLKQTNQMWIGRPLDELVAAWGPPVQSFKADDGGSIHSWSMVIVKRRRSEECRRSLLTDSRGVITRWLYDNCPRQQPRRDPPSANTDRHDEGRPSLAGL
jgi:hypothetical protein